MTLVSDCILWPGFKNAEYELVLRYRETLERGALPVVQDGCGSCPSARAQM